MKTLMKKIGGCKKARYWNMARFQTRRWHREHAEPAAATDGDKVANALNPPPQAVPPIQQSIHPSTPPLAPATHERTNAATAIPSPACPPERRAAAGGECQGEGGLPKSTAQNSMSAAEVKWDKNQNSALSQPSTPTTSSEKSGTRVPLSQPPASPSSSSSSSSSSSIPSPVPSSPSRPSVNEDLKNSFVALRANGWSLRSISQKLGIPKSTLFNWESNHETRRAIDVIKCIHIERLQEKYLPSFEEELQKLSSCLGRIERALEKQDFDTMKPEFLLRTFLQLRSRLNGLRCDVHPTDTLDHGPNPIMMSGCISRSDLTIDSDDDSSSSSSSCSSSNTQVEEPVGAPSSPLASVKNSSSDSVSSTDTKWDKNQNSAPSQPSAPTTSSEKSGTRVPTPLVNPVSASAGPTSAPNQAELSPRSRQSHNAIEAADGFGT